MSRSDKTASGGRLSLGAVERFLMAASMGVLCLLTMANVLVRYFTDISFAFTEEISVALLVGASHAFASNHHIAITFFVDRWPKFKPLAHRLAVLCSLLMIGLLAWFGVLMAVAMILGGISGSGPADSAAVGAVMLPSMLRAGYPRSFTAGVIAAMAGTMFLVTFVPDIALWLPRHLGYL
jgi:TRAP-type C4-dicarboxylate transport system permease small subunit